MAEEAMATPSKVTDCGYFDVAEVQRISDRVLLALAAAAVAKTTGGFFKGPSAVVPEVKTALVEYLHQQSENHLGSGHAEVPHQVIETMLENFVRSQRSFVGKVSGLSSKDEKIEELVADLDRQSVWMNGRREFVAKALLKRIDRNQMVHCNAKFEDETELARHKSSECVFRPLSCPNDGCTDVFSALHEETHDAACPFKLLPCEQGCKERVTRGDMDKHCVTTCPMKIVSCPFEGVGCKESLHQCEVDSHCDACTQRHLLMVLRLTQRQEVTIGSYVQRLGLVEKSVNLAERAADVDLHTVSLELKESEAKVRHLSAEVTQLKKDLKARDVSAEVLQLKKELRQLQKVLESDND